MVGTLKRVTGLFARAPRAGTSPNVLARWQELGFHHAPDFTRPSANTMLSAVN
jgi:hypothetical protein